MRKSWCACALGLLLCMASVFALADAAVIDNKNAAGGNKRLNLRTDPATTAGTLGLLYDGTRVERQENAGEWSKVEFGGQTGYVLSEYLITPDEAETKGLSEGGSAEVDVALPQEMLQLREEPSVKAKETASLENGTKIRILAFMDDWVYVRTEQEPALAGYALSKYVTESDHLKYLLVSAPDPQKPAKLRADASAKSKVIGSYYNGVQAVKLFSYQRDGWARVRIGDVVGWMEEGDLSAETAERIAFPYYPPVTSISAKRTELRAQAAEKSDELLICEKDESIEVLGESGNGKWLHVRVYDGNPYALTGLTGYVKASSVGKLAPNTDGMHGLYAVVAPDEAGSGHTSLQPIYKEAKKDADELGLYYQGVEVELLDLTLSAWAKVRAGGQEGFMLKEDLLIRSGDSTAAAISPAPPEVQVTAPGGVTMRAQTKSDSNAVRSLADGSRVTVLGVLGSWCCVRSEDQAGFVPRAQLSGDIGGYARTKENKLAMRKDATSQSDVLLRVPQGRRVLVIATNGEWKFVEYEGQRGYIMSQYLEFVY